MLERRKNPWVNRKLCRDIAWCLNLFMPWRTCTSCGCGCLPLVSFSLTPLSIYTSFAPGSDYLTDYSLRLRVVPIERGLGERAWTWTWTYVFSELTMRHFKGAPRYVQWGAGVQAGNYFAFQCCIKNGMAKCYLAMVKRKQLTKGFSFLKVTNENQEPGTEV